MTTESPQPKIIDTLFSICDADALDNVQAKTNQVIAAYRHSWPYKILADAASPSELRAQLKDMGEGNHRLNIRWSESREDADRFPTEYGEYLSARDSLKAAGVKTVKALRSFEGFQRSRKPVRRGRPLVPSDVERKPAL